MATKTATTTKTPNATRFAPPTAEGLLDLPQAAKLCRVSDTMFKRMVRRGEYPRPDVKLGKLVRWTTILHNRWVNEQAEKATKG